MKDNTVSELDITENREIMKTRKNMNIWQYD